MRKGFSLLECIIAILILAILIALLLPAIQSVRITSARLDDQNKMRQMGIALHGYAAAMDNRLPGYKVPSIVADGNVNNSPLFNILPFLGSELAPPYGRSVPNFGYRYYHTRLYLSKSDPSLNDPLWNTPRNYGATSFPVNAGVFEGSPSLNSSIPDGLANTVWLSQRYFHTSSRYNIGTHMYLQPITDTDTAYQGERSGTFADPMWSDVVPVVNSGGTGSTLPSLPNTKFQNRPTVEEADGRMMQSFYSSGILLGSLDGSVRTVSLNVDIRAFWALMTPRGNEILE